MDTSVQTERVLDALYEAFYAGDAAGMTALMAKDVDVRFLGQAHVHGLEAAQAFFAFSAELLDDLDFRILRRIVDGEWAAVIWEETATVAAGGASWTNHGVDVFRVQNGRITVLHEHNDTRRVREHLPRYRPESAT
jgi:ketosteroid isomerase-like protein